jgi:hypothetical protein
MRRIGEIKASVHHEANELHSSLPLLERLRRSWQLYCLHRTRSESDRSDDDPSRFYERARRLGFYRPRA